MKYTKTIKSQMELNRPVKESFELIFNFDLLKCFKNMPSMPHFDYVPVKAGKFRSGFHQTLYFADGKVAKRRLIYFLPEISFLVSTDWTERAFWAGIYSMDYQYYFVKYTNPEEITCIQWEYRFKFKSKFWMLLFELFLKRRITDYLAVFHNELKEKCCANPNTA